jgi:quercetin dioxygenase-like cupin family protein
MGRSYMSGHTVLEEAYALAAGEGTPMSWFNAGMRLKASTPTLGVVEMTIGPGDEPPLHVHSRESEWFYVLDGAATFYVGDRVYSGTPGAFISLPQGVPHTFAVDSTNARLILLNAPGGFERMFELAPKTVEDAVNALRKYGVEVVGPHPRQRRALDATTH